MNSNPRKPLDLKRGHLIGGRYRIRGEIGRGAAGRVYLCDQEGLKIPRALKILDPRDLGGGQLKDYQKTFLNEIRLLSAVTHRNVVKILDAGKHEAGGDSHLFLVTELVVFRGLRKGLPSLSGIARKILSKGEFISLIEQLLDGLEYLHRLGILHADLKPANILIHKAHGASQMEIRIGDLGVSKVLLPSREEGFPSYSDSYLSRETKLHGSVRYAPKYAIELMTSGQPTKRADLARHLPHLDLFYLGATLTEMVSEQQLPKSVASRNFDVLLANIKPEVQRIFSVQDLDVLKRIIRRLVEEEPSDNYRSVADVRRDIHKLREEYLEPLGVPEFAVAKPFRSIALPTERIALSRRVSATIEHPAFQRLQNLSQLNLVPLIYPGATHSRLVHSLATYEMAKKYVGCLLGDSYFRFVMGRDDYSLALVGALLHDIGHYPLAHAIEDLCPREAPPKKNPKIKERRSYQRKNGAVDLATLREVPHDFQFSQFMLWRDFGKAGTLASLIEREWGIDPRAVMRVISKGGPASEAEQIIQSMIDGTIDIDKLAYLPYDSLFTGASYGKGIDHHALLDSLVIIPGREINGQSQIGIIDKGIAPAESVISSRYSMYMRVYWHHTNRGIMSAIRYVYSRLTGSGRLTFGDYISQTLMQSDRDAVVFLSREMDKVSKSHFGGRLAVGNPLAGLAAGIRTIPKRIFSIGSNKHDAQSTSIVSGLGQLTPLAVEELRVRLLREIERAGRFKFKADCELLLDIPRLTPENDALKPVFVFRPGRTGRDRYPQLDSVSELVNAIHSNFQSLVKRARVFVAPEIRDALRVAGRLQVVQDAIFKCLQSECH